MGTSSKAAKPIQDQNSYSRGYYAGDRAARARLKVTLDAAEQELSRLRGILAELEQKYLAQATFNAELKRKIAELTPSGSVDPKAEKIIANVSAHFQPALMTPRNADRWNGMFKDAIREVIVWEGGGEDNDAVAQKVIAKAVAIVDAAVKVMK